ncbi:14491_t:CDS:1 [Ambispora leptoticha]|uniref:14491_t:CDS:1 n=1 Tax=Ambispora leptoticha TaxID=144679 RepID=A0A9N9GC51_9GLOM|nr:14491_t:CDS:1 [Ambispora leptoticha]
MNSDKTENILYSGPYYLPIKSKVPTFSLDINDNNAYCYLSSIKESDKNVIYNHLRPENHGSVEIHKWTLTLPNPYTLDDASQFITHCENKAKMSGKCLNWAIRNSQGKFIGSIGLIPPGIPLENDKNNILNNINKINENKNLLEHSYEIGYWIASEYTNMGIASAAVRVVTDEIAFREMGLRKVRAFVFMGNDKSMRVLVKAGFKNIDFLSEYYLKNGQKIDAILFVKVPE